LSRAMVPFQTLGSPLLRLVSLPIFATAFPLYAPENGEKRASR
jgi:hypothetical protein